MTVAIHQLLQTVTYTGIVCSLAYMITPAGRVKRALTILCGIVMCIAVVSPIAQLDMHAYSKALTQYKIDADEIAGQGEEYSKNLNRTIIQDECRAYILDKAAEQGAELSEVEVLAQWSNEGYWYPYEVSISAQLPPSSRARLEDEIQTQLGIGIDHQIWNGGTNG